MINLFLTLERILLLGVVTNIAVRLLSKWVGQTRTSTAAERRHSDGSPRL
jgi:hypothetical protein